MLTSKKMLDTMRSAQVYPSRIRVEPNDKATKVLFGIKYENYQQLLNGGSRNIVEKRNHKKHGTIKTPYTLTNSDGFDNRIPLNEFDRAVLSVCISEWLEGNPYTTPAIILRALIGKVSDQNVRPRPNQLKAILDSIDRLMFTNFHPDAQDSFKKLNYSDGSDSIWIKKSPVLPACVVDAKINGQLIENAIFFSLESPILIISDKKSQILRYDCELLNVPNQNNTPLVIALKNYVMRRIVEIIAHKMTTTITWDNIFSRCRISDASKKVKQDAREAILKLFQHLLNLGFIKSFEHAKKFADAKRSYGISFSY